MVYVSGQAQICCCVCIDVYVIESFLRDHSCFAQSFAGLWAASGETLGFLPIIFSFGKAVTYPPMRTQTAQASFEAVFNSANIFGEWTLHLQLSALLYWHLTIAPCSQPHYCVFMVSRTRFPELGVSFYYCITVVKSQNPFPPGPHLMLFREYSQAYRVSSITTRPFLRK